jgi:hypothetical protein
MTHVDRNVFAVSLPSIIIEAAPEADAWWRLEKADLNFLIVSN